MIGRVVRIGACSTSLRVYPPTNILFDAGRLHVASLPRWEGRDLGRADGNPRSAPEQCRELAGSARKAERWAPARLILRRQPRAPARGRRTRGGPPPGKPRRMPRAIAQSKSATRSQVSTAHLSGRLPRPFMSPRDGPPPVLRSLRAPIGRPSFRNPHALGVASGPLSGSTASRRSRSAVPLSWSVKYA